MVLFVTLIIILLFLGWCYNESHTTNNEKRILENGGQIIKTFESDTVKKAVESAENFAVINNLVIIDMKITGSTWKGTAVVWLEMN